jgi:hypothetical protein
MARKKMRVLRLVVAIILAACCFLCVEAQTTLHVSVSTGADGPACGTMGSPCASVQGALTVLGSNPGSINIAAGTYTGASNTNLNITVSNVSIVAIGSVTFSGGGSVRGWTLNGNNTLIENIVFSNFKTTGLCGELAEMVRKLTVRRKWWRNRDQQRYSQLFELHLHQQHCGCVLLS